MTMQGSTPPEHPGSGGQDAKPTSDQPHESTLHNTKASACDSQTQNVMEILPNDEERCTQLMEQQAESVRYLNELNTVRSAESCLCATFSDSPTDEVARNIRERRDSTDSGHRR
jgi:hypothetical protein